MAVVTVAFSDLNNWLSNQPTNTASTPYELEITGLTTSDIGDAENTGTLGCIINQNNTKFVDLSYTQIPNGVTEMSFAFWRSTSLVNAPIIPDGVTYMDSTFSGCTALGYKSIIPSTVIVATNCYHNVPATEWRGTKSQAETFVDSTNPVAIAVDPDTLEEVCTVIHISGLATWIQAQPQNTVDTPYEIEVTGLVASDFVGNNTNVLSTALKSASFRYVDLRPTTIPQDSSFKNLFSYKNGTSFSPVYNIVYPPVLSAPSEGVTVSMENAFTFCEHLKEAPVIPEGVTTMNSAFRGTGITSAPVLPNSVTSVTDLFYNCLDLLHSSNIPQNTSLRALSRMYYNCAILLDAPFIPSGITNLSGTFQGCRSLQSAPIIPDGVIIMTNTFNQCVSLDYKPIIPSTVTAYTDCYNDITTSNWKGTESQIRNGASFFEAETVDGEIQVYNDNRVTYEYSIYNIDIISLSTYLAGLDANTVATAYKIYIRSLTTSNVSDIKTALTSNNRKYVDLSYTDIPSGSTCTQLFQSCTTLICSPTIPSGVTDISSMFKGCTNLTTITNLPNSITTMEATFQNCTSLQSAPTLPTSVTNLKDCFAGCSSLITPPNIPSGVTNMESTFEECNFTTSPAIPSSVTNMKNCFNTSKLTSAPTLPNGLLNMEGTFEFCFYLVTPPAIPSTVTNMIRTFDGCSSMTSAPSLPSGATDLTSTFEGCALITTAPSVPSGVTNMDSTFKGCSSMVTAPSVPSTVTKGKYAFLNCSNLRRIDAFGVSVSTLDSTDFRDMFKGCPLLEQIGHKIEEAEDWRLVYLDVGQSTIEGKIYSRDKTSVTINQISVTKSDLILPIKTDELLFDTVISASDLEDIIEGTPTQAGMLDTHYSWFSDIVIPPTGDWLVLYAKDKDKFKTNLELGGGGTDIAVYPTLADAEADLANLNVGDFIATEQGGDGVTDAVTSGDLRAVTSNAVAQTVKGLYNLPTGDLPQDANVTMSVAHILFQSGRSNPAFLSNYPSITNFNTAGGGCAYTLVTISANDTTARVSQFCTVNYYNTSGSWVYKVYTRRKVDVIWFGWQAIL